MRFLLLSLGLIAALIGPCLAVASIEVAAKKFVEDSSERVFKLYNGIADETYSTLNEEDFEAIFTKLEIVKKIAEELTDISKEAKKFDLSRISDVETKNALKSLHRVAHLLVLGDEYFDSILITVAALHELSTDKDIEPYMGGTFMPNYDDSPIAYYPDIQKIFKRSNNSEELKYYWDTWRQKNAVWSTVNFYSIIQAFIDAAKILDINVLDLWFRHTDNQNIIADMEQVMTELKPAYKQLHAFIRNELHKKYGSEVIDPKGPIPDHLFEQVLAQDWYEGSVIEPYFPHSELPPYDAFVKDFDSLGLLNEAEKFYTSLGFQPLNEVFREKQLKQQGEAENMGDCRAAIFDLTPHVYMKYCKKVDFRKFMQNHGFLGRVHYAIEKHSLPSYYFSSYNLEYPVGEAIILSASTPKHLSSIGLAKDFQFTEKTLKNRLLRMGIHTMLNIPLFFVHTKLVVDFLNGVTDMDSINRHYWKLMEDYAGIEPPLDRPEGSIDFPYKFYMDLENNHQTKKFISEILGYQFYRSFCKKSFQSGPLHNCDFYGSFAIGSDLKSMMALGSSKPMSEVLSKVLPDDPKISADALLEYYKPILDWMKSVNELNKLKIGWTSSKYKSV